MAEDQTWPYDTTIYRSVTKTPFDRSISCGFLNKSGWTTDVQNEKYDRLAMIYLLTGNGSYRDDHGQNVELKAGDIFFRCPDRVHTSKVNPDSNWRECFVSVRSEWYTLFRNMDLIPTDRISLHLGETRLIPEQTRQFIQRLQAEDTPASNVHVEFDIAGLMRWALEQAREHRQTALPHQRQLQLARTRIRQAATSRQPLEELLGDIGMSYSRLRSRFRQTYGISPGNYRLQVRIEEACALVETSGLSIKEIADRLGYSDAFTFSKQFRQHVGVSPRAFKERRAPRRQTGK